MEKKQSQAGILKGAMILAIAVFVTRIIGMLYRIPVTNILGNVGNYIYSGAFQVYTLLITFCAVGIPSAISKLVSERVAVGAHQEAHRVYKIALIYSSALASILGVGLWVFADRVAIFIGNEPALAMPLRALAPTVVIATIMAVMRGYFQGLNKMTPTAVSQVIEQIFNAAFSILLAYLLVSKGVEVAAFGSTMGTGIGAVAGLIVLLFVYWLALPRINRRIANSVAVERESNRTILKKILFTTIPIVVTSSIFAIMTNIDQYMLAHQLPESIEKLIIMGKVNTLPIIDPTSYTVKGLSQGLIGQYLGKYFTLVNVPVGLIITLGMAATPAIAASMAVGDYKDVRRKTNLVIKAGMIFAAPAAIGMMLFGREIMGLIYSSSPDGGELLVYGGISIIFITIAQLTAGVLQGMGKQQVPTIHAAIACGIKIVLNLVLIPIPQLHIYSVIHSTTICYLIFAVLNLYYVKKHIGLKLSYKRLFVKPVFSAAVMGLVAGLLFQGLMLLAPRPNLWLLVVIPIAAGVYFVVGLLTRTITTTDIAGVPGGKRLLAKLGK